VNDGVREFRVRAAEAETRSDHRESQRDDEGDGKSKHSPRFFSSMVFSIHSTTLDARLCKLLIHTNKSS
jgi:hypothetical protein